jgi:histone H2A
MAVAKTGKKPVKQTSRSAKAGLVFPVGRVASYLKHGAFAPNVSEKAAICLAAVLEYLTREILELAV